MFRRVKSTHAQRYRSILDAAPSSPTGARWSCRRCVQLGPGCVAKAGRPWPGACSRRGADDAKCRHCPRPWRTGRTNATGCRHALRACENHSPAAAASGRPLRRLSFFTRSEVMGSGSARKVSRPAVQLNLALMARLRAVLAILVVHRLDHQPAAQNVSLARSRLRLRLRFGAAPKAGVPPNRQNDRSFIPAPCAERHDLVVGAQADCDEPFSKRREARPRPELRPGRPGGFNFGVSAPLVRPLKKNRPRGPVFRGVLVERRPT